MSATLECSLTEPKAPSRVPFEFLGQARALRARLLADHERWQTLASEVLLAANPRPGFRRPKAQRVAELWKALPGTGARLGILTEGKRGRFRIAELRIVPARMRFGSWDEDAYEPSISVNLITIFLEADCIIPDYKILVDVGLHALARRFQRGMSCSDEAILTDFGTLAKAHAKTVAEAGEFTVAGWVGECCWVEGAPVMSVRTYIGG